MLSICSLMAALCVVIMSLGSLVESLDFSLAVLAGLVVMILSSEYGDPAAFAVYLVSGLLALILPLKTTAIFFLIFFGWYPIMQKKINMLKPLLARVVKFLIFNTAMGLLLFVSAFVTGTTDTPVIYGITAILANFCFVLYDTLLDRFLIWYILKLRNRLKF